jgi:hypothetical protein
MKNPSEPQIIKESLKFNWKNDLNFLHKLKNQLLSWEEKLHNNLESLTASDEICPDELKRFKRFDNHCKIVSNYGRKMSNMFENRLTDKFRRLNREDDFSDKKREVIVIDDMVDTKKEEINKIIKYDIDDEKTRDSTIHFQNLKRNKFGKLKEKEKDSPLVLNSPTNNKSPLAKSTSKKRKRDNPSKFNLSVFDNLFKSQSKIKFESID